MRVVVHRSVVRQEHHLQQRPVTFVGVDLRFVVEAAAGALAVREVPLETSSVERKSPKCARRGSFSSCTSQLVTCRRATRSSRTAVRGAERGRRLRCHIDPGVIAVMAAVAAVATLPARSF